MRYNHNTVWKDVLKRKKRDTTRYHDKGVFCIPLDAMMRFMGTEMLTKNTTYTNAISHSRRDMSYLESVEEDGQMMFRKKIPLWQTPTKTAAFAVLDEFRNIEK